MRHPSVGESVRGTCAGLMEDDVLKHIRQLGISSVELLPVHAFVNDQHLLEKGMTNYWGYNSIAVLRPDPRYLASGKIAEFKEMVAHLHEAEPGSDPRRGLQPHRRRQRARPRPCRCAASTTPRTTA